jgi:hypothetical protein
MEHLESQLAAADVILPPDVLDRIDEIVAPGINLNPARRRLAEPRPGARRPPSLTPARQRRP